MQRPQVSEALVLVQTRKVKRRHRQIRGLAGSEPRGVRGCDQWRLRRRTWPRNRRAWRNSRRRRVGLREPRQRGKASDAEHRGRLLALGSFVRRFEVGKYQVRRRSLAADGSTSALARLGCCMLQRRALLRDQRTLGLSRGMLQGGLQRELRLQLFLALQNLNGGRGQRVDVEMRFRMFLLGRKHRSYWHSHGLLQFRMEAAHGGHGSHCLKGYWHRLAPLVELRDLPNLHLRNLGHLGGRRLGKSHKNLRNRVPSVLVWGVKGESGVLERLRRLGLRNWMRRCVAGEAFERGRRRGGLRRRRLAFRSRGEGFAPWSGSSADLPVRVDAEVPSQLVATGETARTTRIGAHVGPNARVGADVARLVL